MTPEEALQGYVNHLNESVAKVADKQDELMLKFSELSDKLDRIESLVGNFVRETEKLRADTRKLLAHG